SRNPDPASDGAALVPQSTAVLTIPDNDLGVKIQLGAAQYSINAAAAGATAKLTVKRLSGLASGVTVHYALADGTAVGGVDYVAAAGDLTFPATGTAATTQTISVGVLQNTSHAKALTVTPSPPTGA